MFKRLDAVVGGNMKWKYKEKKRTKTNSWRVKTRFAFSPVRTTLPWNDTVIWLERYQTNDQFVFDGLGGFCWYTQQTAPMGY